MGVNHGQVAHVCASGGSSYDHTAFPRCTRFVCPRLHMLALPRVRIQVFQSAKCRFRAWGDINHVQQHNHNQNSCHLFLSRRLRMHIFNEVRYESKSIQSSRGPLSLVLGHFSRDALPTANIVVEPGVAKLHITRLPDTPYFSFHM